MVAASALAALPSAVIAHRESDAAKPDLTGSRPAIITIGTDAVVFFAMLVAVEPRVTITRGRLPTLT